MYRIALLLLAATSTSVVAKPITSIAEFSKAGGGDQRVLVLLKDPNRQRDRVSRLESKGWVNMNQHIANLQNEAVAEFGWRNLNDVVRLASEPVLSKKVSTQEMRKLLASDRVEGIYEDLPMARSLAQSKVAIAKPRVVTNVGSYTGTIAVIDDGIDADHPFFSANEVVDQACFSQDGECPNDSTMMFGAGAARPCDDGCDHGTHVAGIAAGGPGNGSPQGLTGVANGAKLLAVNVFPTGGLTSTTDILLAMEWVLSKREKNNVQVLNMSLGNNIQRSPGYCDQDNPIYGYVIHKLVGAGIAVVISSGNDSETQSVSVPACLKNAISVGSLEKNGTVSDFSNTNARLDIYAPGGDIVSAVNHDQYASLSGTSMAAPHVAGAWLVLSAAFPNATYDEKLRALKSGAAVTDSRSTSNFKAPSLRLDSAFSQLSAQHGSPKESQTPDPVSTPKDSASGMNSNQTGEQRVDGILIRSNSEQKKDKIKWR